jgi:hypothetical protein
MILRTTKKGLRSLFFAKLGLAVLLSGILQLLLLLARVLVLNIHYELPQPQASVASMIGFDAMDGNILGTAFVIMLLRWLTAVAFALTIAAASACLRSTVASALLCALPVFFSPLLALFGWNTPHMQQVGNLLCATPLLQDGSYPMLAVIALAVLFVGLLLAAWREGSLNA